jgi:hypothetical protein
MPETGKAQKNTTVIRLVEAATNGKHQRPATAQNIRPIRSNLGHARPKNGRSAASYPLHDLSG